MIDHGAAVDQERRVARIAVRAGERHARRLQARSGDMPLRQAYELYRALCRRLDQFDQVHEDLRRSARAGFCSRHLALHANSAGLCPLD